MTRKREGFHNAVFRVPLAIWERLETDAAAEAESLQVPRSVSRVGIRIWQRHYGIPDGDMPAPGRSGPKGKKEGKRRRGK